MTLSAVPVRRLLRHHAVPAVVLVVGLLSTAAAWGYVRDVARRQGELRFRDLADETTSNVVERMDAYAAMLRATRGLFETLGADPDAAAFRTFVSSLDIPRVYPGIQGIGWSKLLRPEDLAAHVDAQRASGRAEYRVWPEGPRPVYSAIVYLEPLDWRNARAIGYDMFSEPIRRAAMERARDEGTLSASDKVELVQEAGRERQSGFLLYLPVYDGSPTNVAQRRASLRGWVYAPFRAADLLERVLGAGEAREVELTVWDGEDRRPEALLYDGGARADDVAWSALRQTAIAGRTWTFLYTATPAFASAAERTLPFGVLAGGIAVTLLLFVVTRTEVRARGRAEDAARRTAFLADASQILSSSLDYRSTLPRVAELAAARVVDLCAIHVREEPEPLWATAHRDPRRAARVLAALRATPLLDGDALGPAAALRDAAPRVRNGLDPSRLPFAERAPELAALLRDLGIRASLTVPLLARGAPLGGVTFLSDRRRFGGEDVALAQDLGRLVAAAIDTSRLYAQSQDAIRQRDEFLSIASHELRTPLTSLALQSESLRARATRSGASDIAAKAEVIRRNVDRLSRLVADLLDLSRITAGRLELELEEVDLADLAGEVVVRFEDEARRAGSTLRLDAPESVTGLWDRMRLDQVLTNLVSNALKYGPGAPVEVRVRAEGDRAAVSVRDHGIGISPEDQDRIFGRFERAVSKRNYGGFGLGLWIVRRIVEALGGSVRVESAPARGSTFTVELARGAVRSEASREDSRPSAPA